MTEKRPATRMTMRRAMVIFVVVAVGLLALAATLIDQAVAQNQAGSPIPGGLRTTGTVVSDTPFCSHGCTYQPIIDFTAGGQTYTFAGVLADGKPRLGSTVTVSYDPANPEDAHDLSGGSALSITDAALGAAFAAAGLLILVLVARAPRRMRAATAKAEAAAQPAWDPTWDESLRDAPRDSDPGQ